MKVARLAASFNRAAGQIEQLVQGHKALLANASHECAAPWRASDGRGADEGFRRREAQDWPRADIAELDWLVDEILLAAGLDTVTEVWRPKSSISWRLPPECAPATDDAPARGRNDQHPRDARCLRRLFAQSLENARRHGCTRVQIARDAGRRHHHGMDSGPACPPSEFEKRIPPFYRPRMPPDRGGIRAGSGIGTANRAPPWRRCSLQGDGRTAEVAHRDPAGVNDAAASPSSGWPASPSGLLIRHAGRKVG